MIDAERGRRAAADDFAANEPGAGECYTMLVPKSEVLTWI